MILTKAERKLWKEATRISKQDAERLQAVRKHEQEERRIISRIANGMMEFPEEGEK